MTRHPLLIPLALAALAGCGDPTTTEVVAYSDADISESVAFDNATADLDDAPRRLTASGPAAPAAPSEARAQAAVPSAAPADLGRHLRRSADLRVETEAYDETLRSARAVAGRHGGLVTGEDGSTYGETAETTLTLRVPSAQFDAALDALAGLGTVASRSVSVDDVTGQVVDVEARLRALRAAEGRYVAFLGQTGTVTEMLEVQRQLEAVRSQVEVLESQARSLRGSVSLSTIRATVVGPAVAPAPAPGLWAAASDAVALGWSGVWAVVIGVLPLWPLAVVAGLGLVVWRRLSPRVAV